VEKRFRARERRRPHLGSSYGIPFADSGLIQVNDPARTRWVNTGGTTMTQAMTKYLDERIPRYTSYPTAPAFQFRDRPADVPGLAGRPA
jgi:hypothetical protein